MYIYRANTIGDGAAGTDRRDLGEAPNHRSGGRPTSERALGSQN